MGIASLAGLPGIGEIACQQVLQPDGSVYSVQSLLIPERAAEGVTAELLLDRYLRLIKASSLFLVRPTQGRDGLQFRLAGTSLAFLRFAPAERLTDAQGETVRLRTVGGFMVGAGEPVRGDFSFRAGQEAGGVRVTVQLTYCRPLLLGSGPPSPLRRFLFSATQGRVHKAITVRFLAELYRNLTGDRRRLPVRKVQVREGADI